MLYAAIGHCLCTCASSSKYTFKFKRKINYKSKILMTVFDKIIIINLFFFNVSEINIIHYVLYHWMIAIIHRLYPQWRTFNYLMGRGIFEKYRYYVLIIHYNFHKLQFIQFTTFFLVQGDLSRNRCAPYVRRCEPLIEL